MSGAKRFLFLFLCATGGTTAGAVEEERPAFEDLMARVECTVWAEGRLEETWADRKSVARHRSAVTGDRISHELFATSIALDAYLNRHVFVWMDAETYRAVVDAHWPDGVENTDQRARLCKGYLNRHFLRYVRNPDDGYENWRR